MWRDFGGVKPGIVVPSVPYKIAISSKAVIMPFEFHERFIIEINKLCNTFK